MATGYDYHSPDCPGCPECAGKVQVKERPTPACKATPGSLCECELLYLAATNGELLASNERIKELYNRLAAYYLRSSQRHCVRRH